MTGALTSASRSSGPVDRHLHPGSVRRVIEHELHVYRRLWHGSVFTYFIGPSLFLGAIGIGLGGLVQARTDAVDGVSYLQFVAPGLLAASLMQSAAGEAMWPILGGMKWIRTFHAMAVTAITPAEIYTGEVVWIGLLATLSGTAFLLVAAVLGALASWWAIVALPLAVLTALSFAAPIMAFSATQESDARFTLIMRFLVQPLFLFSGTFFPVDQLPGWLQAAVWFSPLWHGTELCRAATTGQWAALGLGPGLVHLAVLLTVIAVGWWFGTATFTRRLAT